jgi:predicted Zn-dependent protease with MMP-like domain
VELDETQFNELVDKALGEIPLKFREEMENVGICIAERPTAHQLGRYNRNSGTLLGLFEGVPKTAYGQATMGVQPSKITLFSEAILFYSRDLDDLKKTIKVVLMHEIGHYFGFNEEQMFVMDKRLRKKLSQI